MNILTQFFVGFETDATKATVEVEGLEKAADKAGSALAKAADPTGAGALDAGLNKAAASAKDVAAQADHVGDLMRAAKLAADQFASAVKSAGGPDIGGGIEKAKAAADRLGAALRELETVDPAAVEHIVREVEQATREADKLDAEMDGAGRSAAEAARQTDKLADNTQRADRHAGQLGRTIRNWVAGLALAQVAISAISGTYRDLVDIGEKASRFNFNAEGLNAFNQIVDDMGGNSEDAERYLKRFSDSIRKAYGDAASEPGKALASLKVSAKDAQGGLKDTETVLLDLAGALEHVSQRTAIDRLRRLGIVDPAMIKLIMSGRIELEKLMATEKAKGLVTAETVRKVREFKLAMDDAKDAIATILGQFLAAAAGPGKAFADWLVDVSNWLQTNRELVKGWGIGTLAALAVVAAFVAGVYGPAWWSAAAAVLAATWPVIAIAAAVIAFGVAFALVWEDVQAYLKGTPSLIGELFKRFEWLKDVVGLVGQGFALMAEAGRAAFDLLASIVGLFWQLFLTGAQTAIDAVKPMLNLLAALFGVSADAAGKSWGDMFAGWIDKIKTVIEWVRKLTGLLEAGARAVGAARAGGGPAAANDNTGVRAGQTQIADARASPLASSTSQAHANRASINGASRTTTVQVGKVEVHTQATDAKGMAAAAGGALQDQLRRTAAQHDDGVDR